MAQANLPISYWGDVLLTTAYVLNRVPSKSVSSTPYELWTSRKFDLSHLRPQGSAAYIHNLTHKFGKLGAISKKCIFIIYSEHSKGYVFISEQADGPVSELESRDVSFLENEFPNIGEVDKDFQFYELEDPNEIIISNDGVGVSTNPLRIATLSGSKISDFSISAGESTRKSNCRLIPRRRFEIEG